MWKRLAIYLFPALIDGVVAQVLFVNTVRAARMGTSALGVAGMITSWSLVYALVCPLVGRWARPSNAAAMMIAGCLTLAVTSLVFLGVDRIGTMYLLVALCSVSMAFFFTPFQVFMKAVTQGGGRPLSVSAGLYTFAWSAGFAAGPFISGFLMELDTAATPRTVTGWQWTYLIGAAVAVLTAWGIRALANLAAGDDHIGAAKTQAAPEPAAPGADPPDLAWLGWTAGSAGILVLSMIRGLFPVRAVALGLSDATQGTYFFLLSMAQACCALALARHLTWMYRARPALLFGLCGLAGTLLTGWGRAPLTLYAGALAYGTFMGALFFVFVFYAIAHPRYSARNVARNEMVVGLCGILGPLAGGLLGDAFTLSTPYALAAVLISGGVLLQIQVLRRLSRPLG